MSRFPAVGGDSNAWGTVLNDLLSVSLNSDGTLKNLDINLKDTCVIDGVTDDSTAFTAAYAAAAAAGVGLYMPGGTLIKGNDTLRNNVMIDLGGGTIKLKNGANTDLFSANTGNINLTGTFGTGPTSGVTGNGWGFRNGTLDGNQANQSGTSYVLRYYGWGELFENLIIQNGRSGNVLRDWYGPTPNAIPGTWNNVRVGFAGADGLVIGGPTDLKFVEVHPNNNNGNNWHVCQNAAGLNAVNCHSWAPTNSAGKITCLLLETSSCVFTGCEFEGSNAAQVVILGDRNVIDGWIFAGGATGAGIKIGQQSGETPFLNQQLQSAGVTTQRYVNSNKIEAIFTDITSANGSIWYDADSASSVRAVTAQASGAYTTGVQGWGSYDVCGIGLTPDGSAGKSPIQQYFSSAFLGYVIGRSSDGKMWVVADTFDGAFDLVNGCVLQGFSDALSTLKWSIDASTGDIVSKGNLSVGQSATTPDPGAGGTITTANIGLARVTPAASRTGVIMQAGTVAGQRCTVVNNSGSFTIQFAVSGTSHVALGTGLTIPVNGKQDFIWDSVASLWY